MKPVLKCFAKIILFFIVAPIILPGLHWYIFSLPDIAIWIYIWLLGFVCTMYFDWSFETKGWLFLVFSIAVALIGADMFKGKEYKMHTLSVELLSQIMIVTGSGVGANLIAHWMINRKVKSKI